MKTNIFKKVFACVLALSMMAIPSLSLANTGTTLYDFDFETITDGTYNVDEFKVLNGVNLDGATLTDDSNDSTYIVSGNVGNFTGTNVNSGTLSQFLTFNEAITDGVATFDVAFDKSATTNISNRATTILSLQSATTNFDVLTLLGSSGTNVPHVLVVGTDTARTEFKDGSTYLSKSGVHNLRVVVMRADAATDWTLKLYDLDTSSTQEILETTLSKDNFPSITKVRTGVYVGGGAYGTDVKVAFTKFSATKMSYADANRVTVELPSTNFVGVASPSLTVNFSGAIAPATLSNITFAAADGVNKVASVAAGADNESAIITLAALTDGETYTLTVPATVTDASGNAVTAASKQITADAALDALYSFDFANVPEGTYDINTIKTAQGVYLNGATLTQDSHTVNYIVSDGLGKFTGTNVASGTLQQYLTFNEAITEGAVAFDVVFDKSATTNISNRATAILAINSASTEYLALNLLGAPSTNTPHVLVVGPDNGRAQFKDGSDNLSKAGVHNLRVVVMRANAQTDWTLKIYDMDVSSTQEILETTLPQANFPSITKVRTGVYVGGGAYGTDVAVAFKKFSANTVSYADLTRVNVTLPTETQVGVASPSLTVNFSGAIDPATLSNITFAAADGVNRASVTAGAGNTSAILTLSGLTDGTTYTLTVPATVTDANGNAVTPASKQIIANADLDALYSFDFANVEQGSYTVETIKTAQGVYLNDVTLTQGSNPSTYNVADGVGTLTGSEQAISGGRLSQVLTFNEAITSGAYAFDVAFNAEGTKNLGNSSIAILRFDTTGTETSFGAITLSPAGSTTSPGPVIVGQGHLSSNTKYPFIGGGETYAEDDTYNLRAVIMRNSANDDWNYRLYDLDLSSETPIFTKVLSKDAYTSIKSVSLDAYLGGSYAGTTTAVALTKYSARNINAADIDAVEAAWVTDAEGAVVQNLGTTGGTFNVVADVNTLSGKLYAAVYTNGWKLIDVKSATPSATGTTTIPFTGLTVGADSHVKLFYWNNGFQPLTSFIDPLVK